MSLESAHKGYEYQDLLTAVFIIDELLKSNDSKFIVDRKENQYDKFDDLTFENSHCIYKKQVKYSESKVLSKVDLSQKKYDLALDTLFASWKHTQGNKTREYRICLAWEYIEDNDELDFLILTSSDNIYEDLSVKYLKIDIDKIWPQGERPINSWRRLRGKLEAIERHEFAEFLESLIIEVNLPKASHDLYQPEALEKLALKKLGDLGIGKYPNERLNTVDVLSNILMMVKGARANGKYLVTSEVLYNIGVVTSFGSIEQEFQIHDNYNVVVKDNINSFIESSRKKNALIGAPGSGKSWFVNNLVETLKEREIAVVRHFCYTGLNDEFEIKRITKNVFMANLLNELIENYPELDAEKTTKYGVDFDELQKVINAIEKETWIIIDGLDHIERIYSLHSTVLAKIDTDIVSVIGELQIPSNVKLLLVSQPINEVTSLSEHGYKITNIPKWEVSEVKLLMELYSQKDIQLTYHESLSDYLLEKCEGNPLYLTYLLKEINYLQISHISKENLETIPNYNNDLNEYYAYLISKIDEAQRVAQILSGAHFFLSIKELIEITKQGIFVTRTINEMKSVLEHNPVSGGYLVYHESFRRFIIEDLESKGIDPTEVIYKELIEWLKAKGFYKNRKAYLNLLFMLYESREFEQITGYIGTNFVVESMAHGHSISAIKRNYAVLLKSACKLKNYKLVITITEISGMIDGLQYSYEENEELYYASVGSLYGYSYLNELVMYEGKRNLSLISGLKVCYMCSENGVLPYWEPYIEYLNHLRDVNQLPDWDKDQSKFVYRAYISSAIDMQRQEDIVKNIESAAEEEHKDKKLIIINEFSKRNLVDKLIDLLEEISDLQKWQKELTIDLEYGNVEQGDFESILNFFEEEMSNTDKLEQIKLYRRSVDWIAQNNLPRLKMFTVKISNRNWFYNWLIFVAKVSETVVLYERTGKIEENILKNYQILLEDTEVFKGEPRTCDLYYERTAIYNSLLGPLKYIKTSEGWEQVITLLQQLSIKTETYLRGAHSGPLTSDKLIELYIEICNEKNVGFIVEAIKRQIDSDKGDSYYSYLADYSFKLVRAYSAANLQDDAKSSFREGITYLLAYTFRKDRTLSHVLDSVEATLIDDKHTGIDNILKLKTLADAVTTHTDGRSTKYYPREWYEVLVNNDLEIGLSYLVEVLPIYSCHWIFEECLKEALIASNGEISPEVESILYKTLPNCKTSDFLTIYLNVIEKLFELGKFDLGIVDLNELCSRLNNNEREKIKDVDFLKRLTIVCEKYQVDWNFMQYLSKQVEEKDYGTYSYGNDKELCSRDKSLDKLSYSEFIDVINQNGIRGLNFQSLIYYFEGISGLDEDAKTFLSSVVASISKSINYSEKWEDFIEIIDSLQSSPEIQAYLYVLVYLNHQDGWLQGYTRKDVFSKAYSLSKKITEDTLFEYIGRNLNVVEYGTTIGGNLINALATTNEHQGILNDCWNVIFEIVNARLPGQVEFDWSPTITINESWDNVEKMVYLMLSRLRYAETYRVKWVITGFSYLLENFNVEKYILRPLKKFLANHSDYLDYQVAIMLVMFMEEAHDKKQIINELIIELLEIYPINKALSDIIIGQMIGKNKKRMVLSNTDNIVMQPRGFIDRLSVSEPRIELLEQMGLNPYKIAHRYSLLIKNGAFMNEHRDLLYDQFHNVVIPNQYFYNEMGNIMTGVIEEELINYIGTPVEDILEYQYYSSLIEDVHLMMSETTSNRIEPSDLNWDNLTLSEELVVNDGWVRIGYFSRFYESRTRRGEYYENNDFQIKVGCVVFGDLEDGEHSFEIYNNTYRFGDENNNPSCNENRIKTIVTTNLLPFGDMNLSYYQRRYLGLKSSILNQLGITVTYNEGGIIGVNEAGDTVLRYTNWSKRIPDIDSISYFIPYADGAQLEMREAEFDNLCEIIGAPCNMKHIKL